MASDCLGLPRIASDGLGWPRIAPDGPESPPSSGSCILDENAGNKNACLNNAPGLSTEFAFEVCLQPLRIALIYTAACLLFFPCHPVKGGEEALIALEDARLDLADGMRALMASECV